MKLHKKAGATSEIWQVWIADSSSTTGAGLTGLAFGSSGLTAYYHRDTDTTATAITLVTMTVGTFTSSGFKEIDATNMPGWYQFCPPNAAIAASAKSCAFLLKGATNMAQLPIEVQLTAVDVDSATAFMTSVATVTTVTNQLTAAQIATGVWQDATAGDFTTASSIGKSLYTTGNAPGAASGIALVGSNVGTATSVTGAVGSVTGNVGGNVVGSVASVTAGVTVTTNNDKTGYALSAAGVQAVWDALTSALTTVGSIGKLIVTNLDALISSRMATYTQPTGFLAATFPGTVASTTNITGGVITTVTNLTNAPTAGDLTATMKASVTTAATAATPIAASVSGAVGSVAAAGINAASFAADVGFKPIRSNTATAGSGTSITLDAGASATNSFYVNDLIVTTGGTGAGQARFITAYVGATKVATVTAWATNPDNTTTFAILPFDAIVGATAPTAAQVATAVWQDLLSGTDFSTVASIGKLLKDDIDSTVSGVPAAVLTAATAAPIAADAKKMNGTTIIGAGTSGNLWRA